MISHAQHWSTGHAGQDGAFDPADVEGEGEGFIAEDFSAFDGCAGGGIGDGVGSRSDEAGAVEDEAFGMMVGGPGVEEDVQVGVEVDVGELECAL